MEAYGSPYEVERIKPTEAFMLDMITRGLSPQDAAAEWVSQILDSLQLELGDSAKTYNTIKLYTISRLKNLSSLGYPDLLTTA